MPDKFLQLVAISATVNYEDNKKQAALAAELCREVIALASEPKYDSLNVVAWSSQEAMERWARRDQ